MSESSIAPFSTPQRRSSDYPKEQTSDYSPFWQWSYMNYFPRADHDKTICTLLKATSRLKPYDTRLDYEERLTRWEKVLDSLHKVGLEVKGGRGGGGIVTIRYIVKDLLKYYRVCLQD